MEIDRRCKAGRTIVVENGVNTRTITPVNTTGSKTILFMGTLDYFPNRDAAVYCARTIMPLVWDLDPSIELCIAGRNPNEALMELGSDSRISVLANPPDMRDVASHCALTVVPLRVGGGTRLKILDSLALGLPVVSTSVGCEGLEVTDGEEVLIRDEPARIAEAIVNLVSDSRLWETLRLRGRRLVELRYDWQTIFGGLESELVCLSGEHDQPAAVALPECGEERSSTPESTSSSQPD
jgi:glycosyltransferase involved in cell wall biosynthesis